jgi:tRNA pseudouridine55 synthase
MDGIINLYKERGETPLERIERFRKAHSEYKGVPLSYAGRLDPMAEGVMLVLSGKENKEREGYLKLTKEYEFEVLFGFATDTYDALGLLTDAVTRASFRRINNGALLEYVSQLPGRKSQKYAPFSSKPFEGKPMFVKARKGELPDYAIPSHEIEITKAALAGMRTISNETLLSEITEDIGKVRGDFRQEQILRVWEEHVRILYGLKFDIAKIRIACSSGTYVRVIAHDMGAWLGVPALAYRIVRTKVGKWGIRTAQRS